ncbi:ATP-binding protein [Vibrio porteresiae]
MIGLASVGFAALIAWLISGTVLRRVHRMKNATQQLAQGNYGVRLTADHNDEVDELANHFNLLAQELDDTEQKRRQFMTDISHELRTPLAVMRAEIEAIEDGIRPMNSQSLGSLAQQMGQLNKLVDDLHELSVTDNGLNPARCNCVDLAMLIQSTVDGIETQALKAGLELKFTPYTGPMLLQGDEVRLIQLFSNLLNNSVKYTQSGGQLVVRCEFLNSSASITIEDSAPGVAAHHLPHLFERFYRCDSSRSRKSGGSGLGLAICRNIVIAHHGQIVATQSPLGGLRITITLPVSLC